MYNVIKTLIRASPTTRKGVIRLSYEAMSRFARDPRLCFMNYGYASLEGQGHTVELEPADEWNRYQIQLYHHTVAPVDLRAKQVVEVGSGRGGGAAWLMHAHAPAQVTGVELARSAVRFSQATHRAPGLSFVQGDAERLPLPEASADVVLNVESSHGYGSMERFLAQAHRVLRPGGALCFADVRDDDQLEQLRRQLARGPLELVQQEEISANVIAALEQTHQQKEQLLAHYPRWVRGTFRDQSGMRGGTMYRAFLAGERRYLRCLLRKPAEKECPCASC